MGREAFGRYAEQCRKALGITRGRVATRLVMASGGDYFDTTSVRNIEEGKRELTDPNGNPLDLYEWLIEILSMDPDEAHAALLGLPEGISVEDIRELRRTASERHAARTLAGSRAVAVKRGYENPAAPVLSEQAKDIMATWFASPAQRDAA